MNSQGETLGTHANSALLWVAAAPAAAAVVARLMDVLDLSDLLATVVLRWREITRSMWTWLVEALHGLFDFPPINGGQKDLLTFSVLLVASSVTALLLQSLENPSTATERAPERAKAERITYTISFLFLLAVFALIPVTLGMSRFFPDLAWTERGLLMVLVAGVLLSIVLYAEALWRGPLMRRVIAGIGAIALCWFIAVFADSPTPDSEIPSLTMSLVIGIVLLCSIIIAQRVSPRALSRVAIFAFAVFVVDRIAWLLTPIAEWLSQLIQSA